MEDTVIRFFIVGIVCVLSVSLTAYTLGLSSNERVFVKAKALGMLHKFSK